MRRAKQVAGIRAGAQRPPAEQAILDQGSTLGKVASLVPRKDGRRPFFVIRGPSLAKLQEQIAPACKSFAAGASLSRRAVTITAIRCTTGPELLVDGPLLVRMTATCSDELKAAVLCRAGRYDEAVKLLPPLRHTTTTKGQLETLYLALAEHGHGNTAKAKELLQEAMLGWEVLAKNRDNFTQDPLTWMERVHIEHLRRELEERLK